MWGIIPAAGSGSRIQPLAFSKELLPVGSRLENGEERPKAVSEYLVERLILGGADRLCFVISPAKGDILRYYGTGPAEAPAAYVVQPRLAGLCDAIFRAAPLVGPDEPVMVGLPDTVWFPKSALRRLPDDRLSFLLFPVERPELFDAVTTDASGRVERIEVKSREASTRWIWGAFKAPGRVFHALHAFWRAREEPDEYFGSLVNAWLAEGGEAMGVREGERYVDVGALNGWREGLALLGREREPAR